MTRLIRKIRIVPVAKPRMTRRDKWAQRPCVMKYRQFCDDLRSQLDELPEQYHAMFYMPMPKSWSKKKKAAMEGMAHKQKPDIDNLLKAVNDAMLQDDSAVWDVRGTKFWATTGSIRLYQMG